MKILVKQTFLKFLTFLTFLSLCNSSFAGDIKQNLSLSKKARTFYVSWINEYLGDDEKNLCHLVAKSLGVPENFSEIGLTKSEFIFPNNQDFSLPNWEDVPRSDLTKYVKSEKCLASIKKYEDTHSLESEKLMIQKTKIDLDGDGKDEDVLRFREIGEFGYYWTPFASDLDPNAITAAYNKAGCLGNPFFVFKYKGKVRQTLRYNYDYMGIYKLSTAGPGHFVKSSFCEIKQKIKAAKAAEKMRINLKIPKQ